MILLPICCLNDSDMSDVNYSIFRMPGITTTSYSDAERTKFKTLKLHNNGVAPKGRWPKWPKEKYKKLKHSEVKEKLLSKEFVIAKASVEASRSKKEFFSAWHPILAKDTNDNDKMK